MLVEAPEGRRWTFKHPTVADAFAELVADSPEMVELYVRGAKLERLLTEVVCGPIELAGASVHVPHSHYDALLDRMAAKDLAHGDLLRFATYRSDAEFLGAMLRAPAIWSPLSKTLVRT